MSDAPQRTPRADSVRNRANILEAARRRIGADGPAVGMAELAVSAGVAVGTLYRHFPTKADLVRAILDEYAEHVADEAERLAALVAAGEAAPGDAVVDFLEHVVEASASNHAVKSVAHSLGGGGIDQQQELRAAAALDSMLTAAHEEGTIRHDVTVSDVYLLITSAPLEADPGARHRWLELVLQGLAVRQ